MVRQTKIRERMVKQKITYYEAKTQEQNATADNVTYAKVTHMMDYNKKLMERLKDTDKLLRDIIGIGQSATNKTDKTDTPDKRIFNIMRNVTHHFQKYKITLDDSDTNDDGDMTSHTHSPTC